MTHTESRCCFGVCNPHLAHQTTLPNPYDDSGLYPFHKGLWAATPVPFVMATSIIRFTDTADKPGQGIIKKISLATHRTSLRQLPSQLNAKITVPSWAVNSSMMMYRLKFSWDGALSAAKRLRTIASHSSGVALSRASGNGGTFLSGKLVGAVQYGGSRDVTNGIYGGLRPLAISSCQAFLTKSFNT